jgi:hypothetical protein
MGCTSLTAPPSNETSAAPVEKVFQENLDTVWKSVQFAMSKYAVKINDIESGIFETQFVRGEKAWISPNQDEKTSGGQRYKISIRALKGKLADGTPSTKVVILKRAEIQRDFFSEFEKLPSDGQEELAIMYRIERELAIAKALAKLKKN